LLCRLRGAGLRAAVDTRATRRRLRANAVSRLGGVPAAERRLLCVFAEIGFAPARLRTPARLALFAALFADRDFSGRFDFTAEAAARWRPAAARAFFRTVLTLRRVAAFVGLLPIVIPNERAEQRREAAG